jgi:hypothetical protein
MRNTHEAANIRGNTQDLEDLIVVPAIEFVNGRPAMRSMLPFKFKIRKTYSRKSAAVSQGKRTKGLI